MKPLVLALLLALPAAPARADDGAYRSLVGMAAAAERERGGRGETEALPVDDGSRRTRRAVPREELRDAVADPGAWARSLAAAPFAGGHALPRVRPAASAPRPAGRALRLWTRVYRTLVPSWRMPLLTQGFAAPVSTGTARGWSPEAPQLDVQAVLDGERRGMFELPALPPRAGE